MPSFAFDSGALVPAPLGEPTTSPLSPQVRAALRDYLLDVIEADLFPIEWSDEDEPMLTAMDPSGQVVTAWVTDRLDAAALMRALTRAGETASSPWLSLAGRYRSGVGGFRRDWNAFREARPPGAHPGPQLYVVAGEVTRDVLDAARVLHGVHVFAVDARERAGGQQILDVTPVQPATVRVLDGDVIREIEPTIVGAPGLAAAAPASPATSAEPAAQPAPATPATPAEPAENRSQATGEIVDRNDDHAQAARPAHEPAEPDPQLQAVAELVGAPMPIEFHDETTTRQGILTPHGQVRVGDRTVTSIEQAAFLVGGEPERAWHDWYVGGFPMAEARAEATGSGAGTGGGRRARR